MSGTCSSKPRTSNHVATLEVAKAEFEVSWKQWKAWAGLEESASKQDPRPGVQS
jgi:hypothetical protein